MPPPPFHKPLTDGIPKPTRLSEVPRYLARRVAGFFTRLFYILRLVAAAAPHLLAVMAVLCLLDGLLPIAGAYISRDLINHIASLLGQSASGSLWQDLFVTLRPVLFLFLLELIYLFLSKVFSRLNNMVTTLAGELVVNHIRMQIITKAKTVDQRSFDDPAFYEKLENANREAGMRPINILNATFKVISALLSAVSFVAVLAALSPWAPVVIILASIPGAAVNYRYRNRSFRYMRAHSRERRQMNYYSALMTNKDYAKEIKTLDLGDTFTEKYQAAFRTYHRGLVSMTLREGGAQIAVALVSTLAHCLLFAYVAYRVIFMDGMIGDYSLYTGALSSIATAVGTILTSTTTIYEGTLFIENLVDFQREPVTVVPTVQPPRLPQRGCAHTVEFRDVSFRYPGGERDVIHRINLTLRSGESLVLVGLNGAGKTTFIKLLLRLYDPTEGVILLDGQDIREYDVAALHDMYGIIFQDYGKYADTAGENIRFGDTARCAGDAVAAQAAVRTAAEAGDADTFITALPQGYDTPLTRLFEEDGVELSGGQWQKLSIARAFYKASDILILDEPTAALDPLAEQEVFNRFTELSAGKISVFVSHRLSSATTAGKIVVLEDGAIVEQGRHAELMARRGRYYVLFSTQASRYTEPPVSPPPPGAPHAPHELSDGLSLPMSDDAT